MFGEEEEEEKAKKFEGIAGRRKLLRVGNSYAVSIPTDWLDAHDLEPEEIEDLTVIANDDVKILNPESESELMKKFEELMD